jgi:hypothetical protein
VVRFEQAGRRGRFALGHAARFSRGVRHASGLWRRTRTGWFEDDRTKGDDVQIVESETNPRGALGRGASLAPGSASRATACLSPDAGQKVCSAGIPGDRLPQGTLQAWLFWKSSALTAGILGLMRRSCRTDSAGKGEDGQKGGRRCRTDKRTSPKARRDAAELDREPASAPAHVLSDRQAQHETCLPLPSRRSPRRRSPTKREIRRIARRLCCHPCPLLISMSFTGTDLAHIWPTSSRYLLFSFKGIPIKKGNPSTRLSCVSHLTPHASLTQISVSHLIRLYLR